MTRRRGRRRKKLLDDLKDRRGYCHLKEEALDLSSDRLLNNNNPSSDWLRMFENRVLRKIFGPGRHEVTGD